MHTLVLNECWTLLCVCRSGKQAGRHTFILIRNQTDQRWIVLSWITFGPKSKISARFLCALFVYFNFIRFAWAIVSNILYIYTDFGALLQQFKWNPCPIFWQKVGHILRNHIDPRVSLRPKLCGAHIHLASLHYSTATNVHWMWKYTTALTKRTNQPTMERMYLSHRISYTRICSDIYI